MRSRRVLCVAMAIGGVMLSGGCTSAKPTAGDTTFDRLARQVARAWPQNPLARVWTTALIPLQPATIAPTVAPQPLPSPVPTASMPVMQLANIVATMVARGNYTLPAMALPAAPTQGQITLPDGETTIVPVESAHTAFGQIAPHGSRPDPACSLSTMAHDCSLTITHVALGTTMFWTNRGETRVPAWVFTVRQLSTPVVRVAISTSAWTTVSPSLPGFQPTSDVYGIDTLSAVNGTHIVFTVATGTCDSNLQPHVYETSTVVVIGVSFTPFNGPGTCGGVGLATRASVTLTSPLGARPLLNVGNGYPVVLGAPNNTALV